MKIGLAARSGLAFALAWSVISGVTAPAQAGDDDVLGPGFTPAAALSILGGSTFAAGPPPPPSPPVSYYAPASTPRFSPYGLRCWYEARQIWGGYGFFVGGVRVCD